MEYVIYKRDISCEVGFVRSDLSSDAALSSKTRNAYLPTYLCLIARLGQDVDIRFTDRLIKGWDSGEWLWTSKFQGTL